MDRPAPTTTRRPWAWVPSLYYAEGLPYVVVMTLSVILYKRLGVSNTDIALYTSWLYLPWVVKPFWAPIVEVLGTKRRWIVAMQVVVGAGLAGVALTVPAAPFFQYTLAFLWLLAFSSATHDIAADGFYLLALDEGDQSLFVGIRSTFYRAAMITGQGLLVLLAGYLEASTGLPPADISVRAVDAPAAVAAAAPPAPAEPGALRLVVSAASVDLGLARTAPAVADTLKAQAHRANVAAGHIPAPETATAADAGPSWWGRTVSGPLGDFLRRTVGRAPAEAPSTTRAGSVGTVGVYLSAPVPAGEELVVHIGHDDGSDDVSVVEGERLTFTADNWNRPARVVFAANARLDRPAAATFRALIAADPQGPLAPDAQLQLADALLAAGDAQGALDAAAAFPRLYPGDPERTADALRREADALRALGRTADADARLRDLVARFPASAAAGDVLRERPDLAPTAPGPTAPAPTAPTTPAPTRPTRP